MSGYRWAMRRARIRAFALGFREGRGDAGMTYGDGPYDPRSVAYDRGRDLFRRVTRGRYGR